VIKEYVIKKGDEFQGIPYSMLNENGREPWKGGRMRDVYMCDEYEILSVADYNKMLVEFYCKLCGKWEEITEKRYYEMLNVLPPVKWERGGFFVSEAYTLDVHSFYQKREGKYYEAMFQIGCPREEILSSLEEFINSR
jgi:hypothetical protein